jgi:hypothetical protein
MTRAVGLLAALPEQQLPNQFSITRNAAPKSWRIWLARAMGREGLNLRPTDYESEQAPVGLYRRVSLLAL